MAFSQWVKDAPTIWAFPTILIVHTLGMSIVAGVSAMLSLIVLGFWPAVPMKPFARAFPLLWFGFGINAVSGTMMLVADATTKLTTVDFYLKMAFVFAGLYVLILMRRQIFEDPQLDKRPLSGQGKDTGLGFAGVLVWGNHVRAIAGLRERKAPQLPPDTDLRPVGNFSLMRLPWTAQEESVSASALWARILGRPMDEWRVIRPKP